MAEKELVDLIEKQARDDGLWFPAQTAPEAYLQQELRKLTATIEASITKIAKKGATRMMEIISHQLKTPFQSEAFPEIFTQKVWKLWEKEFKD